MTFILFFLTFFLHQKDIIDLHRTPIKAGLCKITDNKVIYTYQTQINIANSQDFKVNYTYDLNSIPLDLDTYGGLLNAILLNNGGVEIFDNKLNPIFQLDLTSLNIFSATLIAIWSASEIYVYDNFEKKFYLIDFINNKIINTIQAALDGQPVQIQSSGKKLFILTSSNLWELDITGQITKTVATKDAKSFAFDYSGIWILTDKKLNLINKKQQIDFKFKESLQKICGTEQDKVFMINSKNQLVYFKLP